MYALSFDVRQDAPFMEADDISFAGNIVYMKQTKGWAFPVIIHGIIIMVMGFQTETEAQLYREALTEHRR
jgi:hypothetical protein